MTALLAVIAGSPLIVGFTIGGQIASETVFFWPGMGKATVEAALAHGCPVTQSKFVLMAAMVIGLNFPTDLSYSLRDSRKRWGTT